LLSEIGNFLKYVTHYDTFNFESVIFIILKAIKKGDNFLTECLPSAKLFYFKKMSVNVSFIMSIMNSLKEEVRMRENDKLLYNTLKKLLNEKLSTEEALSLREEGFNVKNPTRKTAVMIALYKKAVAGDLSAIRELRSIVSEKTDEKPDGLKAVMIVDDIRD
jgi:hypothetical protein